MSSDDFDEYRKDGYRMWLYNSSYMMLCRDSLADELQLPTVDIDELTYDFGGFEFFDYSGFSGIEDGYRWSNEEPAAIELSTLKRGQDYTCTVYLGMPVPVEKLGWEVLQGDIVINDRETEGIPFALAPGQLEFSFEVDGDLLSGGESNVMNIYSPLWSPADFGSSDARTLGIAIDKIVFEETG